MTLIVLCLTFSKSVLVFQLEEFDKLLMLLYFFIIFILSTKRLLGRTVTVYYIDSEIQYCGRNAYDDDLCSSYLLLANR